MDSHEAAGNLTVFELGEGQRFILFDQFTHTVQENSHHEEPNNSY